MDNAKSKILVLVEGPKTDYKLMDKLLSVYGIDTSHQIVSYNTNIYTLYNAMFRDKDPDSLDLLQVLKEREPDDEKKKVQEAFWADVAEGKEYEGVVKSLTSFGAFVDLGGVDGLVHISELSWGRIKHPSEVVKEGDILKVFIKEIDAEKKKISLGFKKAEDNPWIKIKNEYKVDDVVECKIVRLVAFGAFAEIIPFVDGLIHISQISNKRIGKPADVLSVGQTVQAKIKEIDLENQKISLSIRELLPEEPQEVEAPVEEVKEEASEE